jgi:hypothetical protein
VAAVVAVAEPLHDDVALVLAHDTLPGARALMTGKDHMVAFARSYAIVLGERQAKDAGARGIPTFAEERHGGERDLAAVVQELPAELPQFLVGAPKDGLVVGGPLDPAAHADSDARSRRPENAARRHAAGGGSWVGGAGAPGGWTIVSRR